MQIVSNIEIINDVYLPIVSGPVGILLSGGADSALLLYFLMMNTSEVIHIFTLAEHDQKLQDAMCSLAIIDKCITLTNHKKVYHHIVYKNSLSISELFLFPEIFYKEKKINALYTGITANPPKEVLDSFIKKLSIVDIEARDPLVVREIIKEEFCMPWTNINKKTIFKIYKKYNLFDNLFPLTRSCNWKIGSKTQFPGNGHCGVCWSCLEREWGLSE